MEEDGKIITKTDAIEERREATNKESPRQISQGHLRKNNERISESSKKNPTRLERESTINLRVKLKTKPPKVYQKYSHDITDLTNWFRYKGIC